MCNEGIVRVCALVTAISVYDLKSVLDLQENDALCLCIPFGMIGILHIHNVQNQ